MGLFKKIFKPVRKVLDKVIPNEIKPFLPYAAALTPFLAPTTGIFGTMAGRALLSGGANIASQLAQEGTTEDDLNLLSAGIATLTGGLSAPEAASTLRGFKAVDTTLPGQASTTSFLDKARNFGLEGAAKGAEFLSAQGEVLRDPFAPGTTLKEIGVAASIPAAQGTGDALYAEGVRINKDQIIDDALGGLGEGATDADRALAIRLAMRNYGFSEEEIDDTIVSAGYKAGGRVGLRFGGIGEAIEKIEDQDIKESMKFAADMGDMDIPMMDIVEEFEIKFKRKPNSLQELKDFYKDKYEYKGPADVKMDVKEKMVMRAKDGGRIGFRDGSSTGNFGADRYASELIEAYKDILGKGDMFFTDVEKEIIEKGEYPSPDKMKKFQDRYENLEKEYDKESDKFGNIDLQDSLLDKDAIKYYNKKVKDLEDREEKLMDKEERLNEVMYTDLDVSGILRTPEFQEWYRLWKVNDPKADDLPNAEYFENMMFDVKRLRPDIMKTKYDVEMKDGGLMDLGGKEMDLRGGGFVPIGKKERADDVPARLSKNEFVMTADAVRAAGGGSVNKGAKRMYNLMNSLEARA